MGWTLLQSQKAISSCAQRQSSETISPFNLCSVIKTIIVKSYTGYLRYTRWGWLMVSTFAFWTPKARFFKVSETRKAILSSSVSKNGEVNTPETSSMKGNSVHIKTMWIKQPCNSSRFCYDFTGPKSFRGFRVMGSKSENCPGVLPKVIHWIHKRRIARVSLGMRTRKRGEGG